MSTERIRKGAAKKAATKKVAGKRQDSPKSNSKKLSRTDYQDLENAVNLLENPGIAAQMPNLIGAPIESAIKSLPNRASKTIVKATESALRKSLRIAVSTMNHKRGLDSSKLTHKFLATVSGGAGGFFGLPALALELPISTTIMLRAIADIARAEGDDIGSVESQLACVAVFALGSTRKSDDGAETGYYATRAALGHAVTEAAKFIAKNGLAHESAPVIARLISKIATRFSVNVAEKVAAQSVPVIGAAGGALINLVFINHFQNMAHGHFTVRRLERKYDTEFVRSEYQRIAQGAKS